MVFYGDNAVAEAYTDIVAAVGDFVKGNIIWFNFIRHFF
jgi:hypothetical protein